MITEKRGFVLWEILLALSIILVVTGVVLMPFVSLRQTRLMQNVLDDTVSLLEIARIKTLGSINDETYGVHFADKKITLFQGGTYSEIDPNNADSNFPNGVEIAEIDLAGGGEEIVFERLSGLASDYGTVTVRWLNDQLIQKQIIINRAGFVEVK